MEADRRATAGRISANVIIFSVTVVVPSLFLAIEKACHVEIPNVHCTRKFSCETFDIKRSTRRQVA